MLTLYSSLCLFYVQRIKKPELRLQDFAGLDMVKDEINEIITFLRDPSIFKDMGARPPRVNTHYEGILKFLVSVQIMIHYV